VRQAISLTRQFAAVDEILTGRENLIIIAMILFLIATMLFGTNQSPTVMRLAGASVRIWGESSWLNFLHHFLQLVPYFSEDSIPAISRQQSV